MDDLDAKPSLWWCEDIHDNSVAVRRGIVTRLSRRQSRDMQRDGHNRRDNLLDRDLLAILLKGISGQTRRPWQCLYFLPDPQGHCALRGVAAQVD